MKKILLTAVLTFFFGATISAVAAEQEVTIVIEKMTCALCPLTVRKAMERVEGVQDVEVDFDAKIAVVTFDDSKTTVAAIARASTEVGYPGTPVKN